MILPIIAVPMAVFHKLCLLSLVGLGLAAKLRNTTIVTSLRGGSQNSTAATGRSSTTPCQCEANNPAWVPSGRTVPKCVFIDLGAADGNSFQQFLANAYGPVANCPSGQWEALLVEANPQFTPALQAVAAQHVGIVHTFSSTAAYMCQATTTFSIDPDAAHNHWGSSMKTSHGSTSVTVPTINVNKLVAENVIPGDWVILKVDIEGAEYDVVPCLAQFQKANLLDIMFLEEHGYLATNSAYSPQQYAAAKTALKTAGVNIPFYHSGTLMRLNATAPAPTPAATPAVGAPSGPEYDKKGYKKDWRTEWEHGDFPGWKKTYPKAALPYEDRQSDGKIGN